jgi:hypothetical protein
MAEHPIPNRSLIVRRDQPLFGVLRTLNGVEYVEYSVDNSADPATASQRLQDALAVIGAWQDLDWEEAVEGLERIRHESAPTPPTEL